MKVGTDGVLIGAWAGLSRHPARVLDVGSGTGLVALMIAQRSEEWNARVHGVEIDHASVEQARQNAEASPWSSRITIFHDDFSRFIRDRDGEYGLIVSNPPYFTNSLASPDSGRTTARHAQSLTYDGLAYGAAKMLAPDGVFAVIIPTEEEAYMVRTAFLNGLFARRKTYVVTVAEGQPKRVMLEFDRQEGECLSDELTVEQTRGVFGTNYMALTRDFYLKF